LLTAEWLLGSQESLCFMELISSSLSLSLSLSHTHTHTHETPLQDFEAGTMKKDFNFGSKSEI